jgi:hypothetical protein
MSQISIWNLIRMTIIMHAFFIIGKTQAVPLSCLDWKITFFGLESGEIAFLLDLS